eukprot:19294-Heterococcus_DN1.PRE.5
MSDYARYMLPYVFCCPVTHSKQTQLCETGQTLHVDQIKGTLYPCRRAVAGGGMANLYLAVTDTQLVELVAHDTAINYVVVRQAMPLSVISKLRFRRGHSVVIVLKSSAADTTLTTANTSNSSSSEQAPAEIEYLMNQAYQCVQSITQVLQQLGIPGHQTSAVAERHVDTAKAALQQLELLQRELRIHPTVEVVQQIMDLYRQAAELFGAVDDDRAAGVVSSMHAFLQQERVIAILEGKDVPPEEDAASDDSTTQQQQHAVFTDTAPTQSDSPIAKLKQKVQVHELAPSSGVTPPKPQASAVDQVQQDEVKDHDGPFDVALDLSNTELSSMNTGDISSDSATAGAAAATGAGTSTTDDNSTTADSSTVAATAVGDIDAVTEQTSSFTIDDGADDDSNDSNDDNATNNTDAATADDTTAADNSTSSSSDANTVRSTAAADNSADAIDDDTDSPDASPAAAAAAADATTASHSSGAVGSKGDSKKTSSSGSGNSSSSGSSSKQKKPSPERQKSQRGGKRGGKV